MLFVIFVIENEAESSILVKIHKEYYDTMLYVAKSILSDHALAEDAVSETMIKIIKHIDKILEISSFNLKSYIVIIVRNTALDMLKKRTRQREETDVELEDMPDGELSVLDKLTSDESCILIMQAIDTLPKKLSDVLRLSANGYTHTEISVFLNINYNVVKMRLSRARQAVRKILNKKGN